MELRLFGETERAGDKKRAPAGVGAYADAKRCCDEQLAQREGRQDALLEPGLPGPLARMHIDGRSCTGHGPAGPAGHGPAAKKHRSR